MLMSSARNAITLRYNWKGKTGLMTGIEEGEEKELKRGKNRWELKEKKGKRIETIPAPFRIDK